MSAPWWRLCRPPGGGCGDRRGGGTGLPLGELSPRFTECVKLNDPTGPGGGVGGLDLERGEG